MSETLLDKAKQNYVGYHLHQAVEIAIKYELSIHAVPYQKIHDITQLIQLANQNGVDLDLPEYIDEHSEMFTLWESRTRYIINYRLEKMCIRDSCRCDIIQKIWSRIFDCAGSFGLKELHKGDST